jgi:hypothetical protein
MTLRLQLQPITTAHNQWLSKTRSIPCRTTSVFSSTATDSVPIYESVTSSGSVIRCLQGWTLNFWILLRLNHWTLTNSLLLFGTNRREITTSNSSSVTVSIRCRGNVLSEPLPSNGHIRHIIIIISISSEGDNMHGITINLAINIHTCIYIQAIIFVAKNIQVIP